MDRYGRLLRYVYLDGDNFNARLIREGYAHAYRRFPFSKRQEFIQLEDQAKRREIGLWNGNGMVRAMTEGGRFVLRFWVAATPLLLLLPWIASCGLPGPSEESRQRRATEKAMLRAEIDKFQTDPCGTSLMFRKVGYKSGEDDGPWILICPGCGFAHRPVKGLFPQAIINHLELYSIGGKMALTEVIRSQGGCP